MTGDFYDFRFILCVFLVLFSIWVLLFSPWCSRISFSDSLSEIANPQLD